MHSKTEFKKTNIYHIAVGALVMILTISTVITNDQMPIGGLIPLFLIAGLFVFLGNKIGDANKKAVLSLIILNGLQIVNFNLGDFEYRFLFGPFIQYDYLNADFNIGFTGDFLLGYTSKGFSEGLNYFDINFIQFVLFVYLIDQYRFIPDETTQPWEKEFTN